MCFCQFYVFTFLAIVNYFFIPCMISMVFIVIEITSKVYVYSCIKILGGITTPINTTVDKYRIYLQCKFRSQTKMANSLVLRNNIQQWYFVTHFPQHNQPTQTKIIIALYLLLMQICV